MGSCSKKPTRTDIRPDKPQLTEESAVSNLPSQAKYELPSKAPDLIPHYEDRADLLSRYQIPAAEKPPVTKKKSLIVFPQTPIPPVLEKDEDSFESCQSLAEGVIGTVH